MKSLKAPEQFKSPIATAVMAIVGVGLAYLLVTRALDTGSWWQYLGAVLLIGLSIRLSAHTVTHRSK